MAPSSDQEQLRPAEFWRCRAIRPDGTPLWVAAVWSGEHPDGELVDLPEQEATEVVGDDVYCRAGFDAEGEVTSLVATALAAPKAPPLWFADLPEPTAAPPTHSLVAFSGHGVEACSLVSRAALSEVPVTSADQVAAFRWYPATGEADQLYVQPAWRRRSVASALLAVAGLLNVTRGGPRLWTDGQRTAMGDRLRNASPLADWAADLTHLAPPMTPFDER